MLWKVTAQAELGEGGEGGEGGREGGREGGQFHTFCASSDRPEATASKTLLHWAAGGAMLVL